jgi:hydrogenase maturation protein HypF
VAEAYGHGVCEMRVEGAGSRRVPEDRVRLKIVIRGAVQGVGFRPFVYRLAKEMGLDGWVSNSSAGVFIEIEAPRQRLAEFLLRLEREKPTISFIQSLESSYADAVEFSGFEIRESVGGEKSALVMPDIATCPECLREIEDQVDRRYRYPFTNCTNCGPRYSIIEAVPYDRQATTMRAFTMCAECETEYRDPMDRRFHAQPNACPECGPKLELWDGAGRKICARDEALLNACEAIAQGRIVAVKGLGGFHLLVDARSEDAVRELRARKRREEKPLALMYPSMEMVENACEVNALERRLLLSPEAPIVLLKRKQSGEIAESVAPGNPYMGVMLPYTPLHHLLMAELGFVVVATSGNLSDEPICTDEREAVERLKGIADLFLVHDRPILRHVDDSIVRVVLGRELVLRRARGFAPLPLMLEDETTAVLAVGGHQKNTIAASVGRQVFVSQHIGDLETAEAFWAFEKVIGSFERLYEFRPKAIACDLHPNYVSTGYARRQQQLPVIRVQHHYAHARSCMAENGISGQALAVTWDGSGYGPDGTIWGGEFLRVNDRDYERVARLRTIRLPGAEKAVKEPRRTALGMLYGMLAEAVFEREDVLPLKAFEAAELKVLRTMLERGVNSPATSSVGRLFDAVAAIIGLRQQVRFEGQAAMELEFAAERSATEACYTVALRREECLVYDWAPMIRQVLADIKLDIPTATIARKFHNTLAEVMVMIAKEIGEERVMLTGGCFQNKLLTELAVTKLRAAGFGVYWHQRVPPNDGGIALGQVMAAAGELKRSGDKKE